MRRWTILALAAVTLAGCDKLGIGKHDGGKDTRWSSGIDNPFGNGADRAASPPPTAGLPAGTNPAGGTDRSPLAPGMWEMTFTQLSAKGVNMAEGAPDGSVDSFGDVPLPPSAAQKTKICVSADEAVKVAPKLMSGGLDDCAWQKVDATPGSINGTLVCKQASSGVSTSMEIFGSMLPSIVGTHINAIVGDPAGKHVAVDAMLQANRVGDCPASEAP